MLITYPLQNNNAHHNKTQIPLHKFRPNYGAKDTLRKLTSDPEISQYYSYKLDVRNYFNNILRLICISANTMNYWTQIIRALCRA